MSVFLKANWENIVMANYEISTAILSKYLPKGVTIDLYNDKAYVSLVGFMFKNTKIFNVPIYRFGTFEEINLRFYVSRKVGNKTRRGVVFINETVPYKAVAWLANALYKEHYTTIPTRHSWDFAKEQKEIKYEWLVNKKWNSIALSALKAKKIMEKNSFESFIFEHYYGYTKFNNTITEEYQIAHPSWLINEIVAYKIDCDFETMYGKDFAILDKTQPESIFLAEGSAIEINWKRNKI
ncbi:uncharacterized protein YqjF (DUF2071 family) [Flavobacterium sp. CG_9.10]|uniref:YqjF family protein n=1 Tax=Flavobacterium sp. CG_9.10 TaxID=2787729 RepID=UPI0018CA3A15|nr:DUF2071 domain-containing protein [Flavobacterium sp. CG_9.10]MBG6110182.1 uncharacterized protein YqjF (DUF2071 family) [Flavobacterium sp. CG_9.10]